MRHPPPSTLCGWSVVPVLVLALGCASSREPRLPAPSGSPAVIAPGSDTKGVNPSPVTRAEAVSDAHFGTSVLDPYRWLEDEKSPEVQAWMKTQDAFARAKLNALPARAALVSRLEQLFRVSVVTAPIVRGSRSFYLRRAADKDKAILFWRDGKSGPEKVLLDPNVWEKGTVSLGDWAPSWDGKKLAFAQKPNAADNAVLHVMDVDTGKWSDADVIEGARYATPSWTPDNKGFYYAWVPMDASIPEDVRPGYVDLRHHLLGQPPAKDEVVFPKTGNPELGVQVYVSRDGKYLFAQVDHGWTDNAVYFRRLGKDATWRELVKSTEAHYDVEPWKDFFYVLTDEGASGKRVFRVAANAPARKEWKEIIPEDPKARIESLAIVGGRLALSYLKDAHSELRLFELDGKPVRTVALPGLGTATTFQGLQDRDEAFFSFTSFTTPPTIFRTSVKTGATDVWAKTEVPVQADAFEVEQVFYPSKDGTRVPMFLVHKKGMVRDGNNPTLLYGYGGFDISLTPAFRTAIFPWLEAGGVYAVANLRGGGEYGKTWHEAGRLHHKQNVFDDFIAAAEYLVKTKVTQPARLAINGGSNGGLLVGTAMVQRPDLFGAVVCQVPLLDMVRFPLFGQGRTWIPEYGNPATEADFQVLLSYSPYHHVKAGTVYPPLLMMSSDHDDRVDPMHARKFVALVQAKAAGPGTSLLRIEAHAGHGGADRVDQAVLSAADTYAFLFQALKVPSPGSNRSPDGRPRSGGEQASPGSK